MMKKISLLIMSLLFVLHARGEEFASLRLDAQIKGKASYARGKSESKTQTRNIQATIANASDSSVDKVIVKWVIYGHEVKNRRLKLIKEGEERITISANDSKVVTSPEIKITGNREYKVTSRNRGGRRGKSRSTTKIVPASGEDYYGYAVEIYTGGKLVASYYSKPSIEKDMNPGA